MPKGKVVIGKTRKTRSLRRKFKLGGRKSNTSALSLTTAELLEKYEKPSRNRDRQKIAQVLDMRSVPVPQLKASA